MTGVGPRAAIDHRPVIQTFESRRQVFRGEEATGLVEVARVGAVDGARDVTRFGIHGLDVPPIALGETGVDEQSTFDLVQGVDAVEADMQVVGTLPGGPSPEPR